MPSSTRFISRLLTLLLVLLLGYISARTVNGTPDRLGNLEKYVLGLKGGSSVTVTYRLTSLCSNYLVQMGTRKKLGRRRGRGRVDGGGGSAGDRGKHKLRHGRKKVVNARGRPGSKYTLLEFQSQDHNFKRIYAEYVQMYLCFNRKGRLIIRHDVTNDGRCLFREHFVNGTTMLQSAANPRWYVGFNKRGRPMKGYRSQDSRRRACYQFTAKEVSASKKPRHRHVGPISQAKPNWLQRRMRKRRPGIRDVKR